MTASITAENLGIPHVMSSDLPAEQLMRLAALLDRPHEYRPGEHVPLLWHWALFAPAPRSSALGEDGHPSLPVDAPTAGLPRRMFAGGQTRQLRPLLLGRNATRFAHVVKAEEKVGRSGRLLVVTVSYEIHQDGAVAIHEEQHLIYREAGSSIPAPGDERTKPPATPGWRERITLDRVTLFRFSAATFNSHRIHYDEAYARDVEGYPGIVVHGPLTALLLAETAAEHLGRNLAAFSFKATAPLFEGKAFFAVGSVDNGCAQLEAIRGDGTVAMSATAS